MNKFAVCMALGLAFAPTAGFAQVDLDTTRITCGEFVALPAADADGLAAWFSGWFNQKLGYTFVDLEAFHRSVASVANFCKSNPKDQLFGVIQQAVNDAAKKR